MSRVIQLDFRRSKIQLTILLRETDLEAKFELFQRLNSGGTSISGQELRNAIMAGKDSNILRWFENLSRHKNFTLVCGLSDRDLSTRMDVELILRFIVFLSPHIDSLPKSKSVDVFLTSTLRAILEDKKFDFNHYEDLFKKTFDAIFLAWGKNALRYKANPGTGKFSISFFEAVALGIAKNISKLPSKHSLKDKIDNIGDTPQFKAASGSGKNAQRRIPELIKLGEEFFKG